VIFCVMDFDIFPDEMLLPMWFSVLWSLTFPLTRCCCCCYFLCYGVWYFPSQVLHNTENNNNNNISSGEISNSITQKITTATTSRQGKYQTP
jgi:hypothetical protein